MLLDQISFEYCIEYCATCARLATLFCYFLLLFTTNFYYLVPYFELSFCMAWAHFTGYSRNEKP